MSNSITDRNLLQLLGSHFLYATSRATLIIFMSLYIWDLTESFSAIATFNIVFFIAYSICFTVAGFPIKKGHATQVKNMGILGMLGFFALLFFLKEEAANYLIPLGIYWGIFNSMYWISYHIQNYDLTHNKNRGNYTGIERALNTFISLIMPLFGGWLITQYGYSALFIFGGLVLIATLFSAQISYEHIPTSGLHLRKTWQTIRKQKDLRKALRSGFFANTSYLRSMNDILIVYLFIQFGSELEVGGWISFFSALSIIVVLLVGKHVSYTKYKKISISLGSLLSTSILMITFFPSLFTFILFGSIKNITAPLIGLARKVYTYNLLSKVPLQEFHRVEFIIIREWYNIGFGATLSFVPLLFFDNFSGNTWQIILLLMTIATFLSSHLIFRIQAELIEL